ITPLGAGVEPFVGNFVPNFQFPPPAGTVPTTFNLSDFYNKTPAQVAGTWHVRITNDSPLFDPIKPPVLRDASLIFTSGLKPGVDKIVTTTFVNGTLTTDTPVEGDKVPYPLITAAQFDRGVGPGATIAADNTLSPLLDHQGRIYVA